MKHQVTLTILGQSLTFDSSIEACRTGRNRGKPGPCPGAKRLLQKAVKPKTKPAVRDMPEDDEPISLPYVPPRQDPPKTGAARKAEVAKILSQDEHMGVDTETVRNMFRALGVQRFWHVDEETMTATYSGPRGNVIVRLVPGGYSSQVPGKPYVVFPTLLAATTNALREAEVMR